MTATPPPARLEPEIRLATIDDLAAIRLILALHNNDGPVVVADIVGPYMSYLISRGRTYVAVVSGAIVGFGSGIDTGRSVHLADLFIHPDHLGRGMGRPLLAAALGPRGARTTFASEDPRALPIYVRAGMTPLWPSLFVQGSVAALPVVAGHMTTTPTNADELSAIERAWTGVDRADDHRYWAAMPGADTFSIRDGADIVAIGHARNRQLVATRVLDRLVIHRDADPVATTLVAMGRAAAGGDVMACLFGPHPALRPLLDAGFHVVDRDQFMASDPSLVDPVRLIPNPGML